MSRIRTIKPEFWTNARVVECSTNARLLFIGLWNFCDDYGNHPAAEKTIKGLVFPCDKFTTIQIRRMLDELSSNGLIVYYDIENKRYFHVLGWDHQRIDRRQPARFPQMLDEDSTNDHEPFDEDSRVKGSQKGSQTKSNDFGARGRARGKKRNFKAKATNGHGRSNGTEGFVTSVLEDIENDRRRREESSAQAVPMLQRER